MEKRDPWYGWHTCAKCGKTQTVYCQSCGEPLPEGEEADSSQVHLTLPRDQFDALLVVLAHVLDEGGFTPSDFKMMKQLIVTLEGYDDA